MIEVSGLTKRYGNTLAVDNISFQAQEGEVVGFLGPNGAGKSTTMRILAGLLPPSAGTARVAGFDVGKESLAARSRIGYVPEVVSLYNEMTVRGYLSLMARLRRLSDVDRRVVAVAARCSLTDKLDVLIGNLSHGYRQRVGLAQALIHDPSVLLLDEPTTGLDPLQIVEIRELIRGLGGKHTILLSTHVLAEVEQVATRVLIVNKGRLVGDHALHRGDSRSRALFLRLRVPAPEAPELLASTAAVSYVEPVAGGEGRYRLVCEPGADAETEVARLVIDNGWGLVELSPAQTELETLFLESITRSEL